ncbi:MAG: hypothetical protein ABC596_09365, partial [Candidatus Methanosuratincola petrocarbonis]
MNMNAKIVVALVLACLVVSSVFAALPWPRNTAETSEEAVVKAMVEKSIRSTQLALEVSVYDADGNLKYHEYDPDDPLTQNFIRLLSAFLLNYDSDACISMLDEGNSWRSVNIYISDPMTMTAINLYRGTPQLMIGIGSGSGTPSASSYALFGKVGEYYVPTSYAYSNGWMNFSVSIPIGTTTTITNVGAFYQCTTSNYKFMMAHDSITPVSVVPGDTIAITYCFYFAPQFTENLCKIIFYTFCPSSFKPSSFTLVDINGSTISVKARCENNYLFDNDATPAVPNRLHFGTGSSQVSRNSFKLDYSVGNNMIYSLCNTTAVWGGSTYIASSSVTIAELGVVGYLSDVNGAQKQVLYWRDLL